MVFLIYHYTSGSSAPGTPKSATPTVSVSGEAVDYAYIYNTPDRGLSLSVDPTYYPNKSRDITVLATYNSHFTSTKVTQQAYVKTKPPYDGQIIYTASSSETRVSIEGESEDDYYGTVQVLWISHDYYNREIPFYIVLSSSPTTYPESFWVYDDIKPYMAVWSPENIRLDPLSNCEWAGSGRDSLKITGFPAYFDTSILGNHIIYEVRELV